MRPLIREILGVVLGGILLNSQQSLREAAKNLINTAFSDGLNTVSEASPWYVRNLRGKPNISLFSDFLLLFKMVKLNHLTILSY